MLKLYNCLVFSTASLFFAYVALRMVFPLLKSRQNPLKGISALLVFSLFMIILWVIDGTLFRKISATSAKAAVFMLIAMNGVVQIFCLNNLKVKPSWDFGAIMSAAEDISSGHAIRNWGYFQEYPFNLHTAVMVGTFKYLIGGDPSAPYILNILSVTASIAGACLLAYRLYGQRAAVLAAFFFLGVTPLYLDIPIVYTDTLSMPFAVWSVYIWTYIRPGQKKLLMYCTFFGMTAALGYLIKPVAAIGLAAFVIDFVLKRGGYNLKNAGSAATGSALAEVEPGKSRIPHRLFKLLTAMVPLAAVLFSFVLSISAFRLYVSSKGFDSRLVSDKSLPYTHWLMMGMNTPFSEGGTSSGYGGFSAADLKYSRAYPTIFAKKEAEMEMIKTRLQHFGFGGYVSFLLKKAEWTWTDGTYFVPIKLARLPTQRTILHKFVLYSNGKSNKLYLIFTQFIQTVILSMILAGCIIALKNSCSVVFSKRSDEALRSLCFGAFRLMTLMCFGLMVFLLFWETRSRYLIFLIPVFVVMTVNGLILSFRGMDRAAVYLRKGIALLLRRP